MKSKKTGGQLPANETSGTSPGFAGDNVIPFPPTHPLFDRIVEAFQCNHYESKVEKLTNEMMTASVQLDGEKVLSISATMERLDLVVLQVADHDYADAAELYALARDAMAPGELGDFHYLTRGGLEEQLQLMVSKENTKYSADHSIYDEFESTLKAPAPLGTLFERIVETYDNPTFGYEALVAKTGAVQTATFRFNGIEFLQLRTREKGRFLDVDYLSHDEVYPTAISVFSVVRDLIQPGDRGQFTHMTDDDLETIPLGDHSYRDRVPNE